MRLRRSLRTLIRNRGVAGVDPICGARHWRFADGARARPEALCPTCGSAERHRALWLFLARRGGCAGRRVLHVAPEQGIERRLRAAASDYVSTDLEPGLADVEADLTALPFADDSFDVAIVSHVLEHVPDDGKALTELRRVLAGGGLLVMQHPIDRERERTFEDWSVTGPDERERVFFQRDHVRIYGRDFVERVRAVGFGPVDDLKLSEALPRRTVLRHRLEQRRSAAPERDLEADRIYTAVA
jgi:SAM-dependent methyltransferase